MVALQTLLTREFCDPADRAELASIVGNRSMEALTAWLVTVCRERLHSHVLGGRFANKSVGAVFGLDLADGPAVVLKLFHPATSEGTLQAMERCHRSIVESGFPAPRQLGPVFRDEGVWGVFYELVEGDQLDAHRPEV